MQSQKAKKQLSMTNAVCIFLFLWWDLAFVGLDSAVWFGLGSCGALLVGRSLRSLDEPRMGFCGGKRERDAHPGEREDGGVSRLRARPRGFEESPWTPTFLLLCYSAYMDGCYRGGADVF